MIIFADEAKRIIDLVQTNEGEVLADTVEALILIYENGRADGLQEAGSLASSECDEVRDTIRRIEKGELDAVGEINAVGEIK